VIRAGGDGGAAGRDADIDLAERDRPGAEPVGQVDPRCLPPTLVQTMSLMVWWVNPAEEKSSGAASLAGVAAIALAAQVAAHFGAPW
jgi:hypothetical protein